jgi:hypothetical protein
MGFLSGFIALWCSGPNYGVGNGKAMLDARGPRMVVARTLYLTRFLNANRPPLRWKTLWM